MDLAERMIRALQRTFVLAALAVFAALLIGAASSPAHASEHTFSNGGVTVWVPGKWSVKNAKVFRATPPSKVAFVTVEVTGEPSLGRAKSRFSKLVTKYVGRPKLRDVESLRVGTFEAYRASGTGHMDGMPVRFEAYIYGVGDKVLMGIGFAPSAVQPRYASAIRRILGSIR